MILVGVVDRLDCAVVSGDLAGALRTNQSIKPMQPL